MCFISAKRARMVIADLPYAVNIALIFFGAFVLIAMSGVWIIFEEFTAFTDYTQQWIEFNFFIHYWDKLTIARVYLTFIHVYGGVVLVIASLQIHGLRKRHIGLLHLAPLLLIALAIVTVLGAICWLIVTAVNYNEGFLATGGFIFERMRFKGNVWKDLIYREQSFRLVTENLVPIKSPILKIWVFQRQRDFSCCGWNSYMDYAIGNYTDLPESCCKLRQRVYGCGNNFLHEDRTDVINTRGCHDVMYGWYRSGFVENIVMAILGFFIGGFEFYTYVVNRREYFKLLDDLDDLRKPMMSMSMSTINSRIQAGGGGGGPGGVSATPSGYGHVINFGPQVNKNGPPSQRFYNQSSNMTPSMSGESGVGLVNPHQQQQQPPQFQAPPALQVNATGKGSGDDEDDSGGDSSGAEASTYINPLQSVQNSSGRFPPFKGRNQYQASTPSNANKFYDPNERN